MKGAVLPVLCFFLVSFVVAGLGFIWWWNHSGSLFPLPEFVTNQAGTFESAPRLPIPRTEAGSTVANGRFYIAGVLMPGVGPLPHFLNTIRLPSGGTNSPIFQNQSIIL